MRDAPHPVDELAAVRMTLSELHTREAELKAALVAHRERRVGERYHATTLRIDGVDHVNVEPLPDICEMHRLLSGPVLVVDCETTGLHPYDGDRIVSLAMILAGIQVWSILGRSNSDERRVATGPLFIELFNPGRPSSAQALAVHGLTEADLDWRHPFSEYARRVEDILLGDTDLGGKGGPVTLVAHNAPFDVGFLRDEMARAGLDMPDCKVVDTCLISKVLWPDEPGSLDALATRLGVDLSRRAERHDAADDAEILAECLLGLVDALQARITAEEISATEAAAVRKGACRAVQESELAEVPEGQPPVIQRLIAALDETDAILTAGENDLLRRTGRNYSFTMEETTVLRAVRDDGYHAAWDAKPRPGVKRGESPDLTEADLATLRLRGLVERAVDETVRWHEQGGRNG